MFRLAVSCRPSFNTTTTIISPPRRRYNRRYRPVCTQCYVGLGGPLETSATKDLFLWREMQERLKEAKAVNATLLVDTKQIKGFVVPVTVSKVFVSFLVFGALSDSLRPSFLSFFLSSACHLSERVFFVRARNLNYFVSYLEFSILTSATKLFFGVSASGDMLLFFLRGLPRMISSWWGKLECLFISLSVFFLATTCRSTGRVENIACVGKAARGTRSLIDMRI